LLQAYDSVIVRADVEFGGIDQKFNLLLGRELQAMEGQRPQQVFLVPILIGTDGSQKMSKSLGNYIGVDEPPKEIYGKVMSIPDSLILTYFELLTDVPDGELEDLKKELDHDTVNPMELKKRLARGIVARLYDQKAGAEAEEHFVRVFQEREVPEGIRECFVSFSKLAPERGEEVGIDIGRLLVETGLVESRSEANRLISHGGTVIAGETVTSRIAPVQSGTVIKVGKRRFARVIDTD
jgi:tyrosyl-tRNA synthetase